MNLIKLSLVIAVVMAFIGVASANVYFAGQTIPAVPIYFGNTPFITFGNITGILTFGNATNAKGNIVFCIDTVQKPLEATLEWCNQNQPAGIISVFPPVSATVREVHLGRSMYIDITMPYYNIPEALRQTHILEIDLADIPTLYAAIISGTPVTMDGSTPNEWLEMYEGALGYLYQIVDAGIAGAGFLVCIVLLIRWYKMNMLKPELKSYTLFIGAGACLMRAGYNAASPTGLRRMLTAANDFIINTMVLTAVVITCMFYALFLIETLYYSDLRVRGFIRHPVTIGVLIASFVGWILYLVVIRILYEFPTVSPIGTGLSMLAIIVIQEILLGACGIIYSFATIVMLRRLHGLKGRSKKEQAWSIFFLGTSTISIWFLFAVTATAFTSYWQDPFVPGVTQIMCSFFQTYIQLLQAVSFWRSEKGNANAVSKPITYSTSTHGKTVMSGASSGKINSSSASSKGEATTHSKANDETSDVEEDELEDVATSSDV